MTHATADHRRRDRAKPATRWHDDGVILRTARSVLIALSLAFVVAGCSGMGTPKGQSVTTDDRGISTADASAADNPFIPENRNLGDCISSMPRPDCGSKAQGGPLQFATFGVLMAGVGLVGWRVVRAVRQRDRAQQVS